MSDYDENMYEEYEEPEPSGQNNRPFLVAVSILGAIFILSLAGLIFYIMFLGPARTQTRLEQAAQINAQNTATALAATQIAQAVAQELTPEGADAAPSATPVVVFPTDTPVPTETEPPPDAVVGGAEMLSRTQTVAVLLTQAAQTGATSAVQQSPTALPNSGFADDVGLPGLFGLAVVLLGVIFLIRRMRFSMQ